MVQTLMRMAPALFGRVFGMYFGNQIWFHSDIVNQAPNDHDLDDSAKNKFSKFTPTPSGAPKRPLTTLHFLYLSLKLQDLNPLYVFPTHLSIFL